MYWSRYGIYWIRNKHMKKYKVYIQAYHEVIVESETKEEARIQVIDNLSDYFFDENCMIRDCVVGNAEEVN